MRNLPEPGRDGERDALTRALSTYRYGGVLRGYAATAAEIDQLVALYDAYDAAHGVPAPALVAPALGATLRQAVHDAYDFTQKKRKLKAVRERVFSDIELCPVCGIDPPSELDHVLPRSIYQALALHIRNLVPLCHLCNHRKLAGFVEEGDEGFFHAYYDLLPDVQFLRADVTLSGAALTVDFVIDGMTGLSADLGGRLTNIHQKLELNDRYRAEVNMFVSGHAVSLHVVHAQLGAIGVSAQLGAQARHEVTRFYRNHWRPTLLLALAGHAAFCAGGFALAFPVSADILADLAGPANP